MSRFRKAAWLIAGTLLILGFSCSSARLQRRDDHRASKAVRTTTSHYLSGEIVSVDLKKQTLGVREAVELNRRNIKRMHLTPSTAVLAGGERVSARTLRRGDFVMIRYSDRPDGGSYIEEIQEVSKPTPGDTQTKSGEANPLASPSDRAAANLGGQK